MRTASFRPHPASSPPRGATGQKADPEPTGNGALPQRRTAPLPQRAGRDPEPAQETGYGPEKNGGQDATLPERLPLHPEQAAIDEGERRDEKQIGEDPGRRVAEADGDIPEGRHGEEADENPRDHLRHARKHRQIREADALNGVTQDAKQSQHREKRNGNVQKQRRILQNLGLGAIDEQPGQRLRARHQHAEGEHPVNRHHQRARLHALPDPLGFPCAVILSAVGRHGDPEAFERTHEEHLDPHGRRERRHAGRAQRIVGALEHDASDGRDRELQPHRHADRKQPAGQLAAEPPFRSIAPEHLETPHHVAVAERGRHPLREDRRYGGSRDAPPEHQNAEEVEHDIEHSRKEQEPERRPAVAQRTDHAGQQVVVERAGNAEEGDEQIGIGPRKDIPGRLHDPQNIPAPEARHRCDSHRHDGRQAQADEDVAAHLTVVPRPELLSHGDSESAATAVAEPEDEKHDRGAGSDRRQGVDPQKPPHDHGIDQRIGLLQEVAHKQGQRKVENQRQRPSRRQFLRQCRHKSMHTITRQR